MSSKKKVAALVGAGMVASTHVAACLGAHRELRLKGISSQTNVRAKALADQASSQSGQTILTYKTIDEIAADSDVDFAIVTTPPNVRLEVIEPLVVAGKHILLEKPIGRTLEESENIVRTCKDAGVTLGIVFQHRTREVSKIAKALIDAGEFGRLGLVEFNIPWWRAQSYYDEPGRGSYARDGGGVLISQAIHTIDLALSLAGPVSSITAMAKTSVFHEMESEDYVVAGLEFENGAVGSMVASTASFPGKAESITMTFEEATLHLEAGELRIHRRDGTISTHGEEAATGGGADPMAFTHDWHQNIIENFVATLRGQATLYASGDDALAAHAFIDATVRSARSGKIEYLKR